MPFETNPQVDARNIGSKAISSEKRVFFLGNRRAVVHRAWRVRFKWGSPGLKPALYMSTKIKRSQCTSDVLLYALYSVEPREFTDGIQVFPCCMSATELHKENRI